MNKDKAWSITLKSIFGNTLLSALKMAIGWLSGSVALVADGGHSLMDLGTDLAVLYGLKVSSKPKDAKHPYGHHRATSLCQGFIGLALMGGALGLLVNTLTSFHQQNFFSPGWPALAAALASIIIKEYLYWRTRATARQLKSQLLMANAVHHRLDSLSSVLVFVALLAISLGGSSWAFLDDAVGLVLGIYLLYEGFKIVKAAVADLMDQRPDLGTIEDLREHILPTTGVMGYHDFRARRVGDLIEVDLHLQVNPEATVQEGHKIAGQVKRNILKMHPEVNDVLIHLEPGDPEHLKHKGVFEIK